MSDKERLEKLLAILHDYSDVVDGSEGQQLPNQAMQVLMDFEAWERGIGR